MTNPSSDEQHDIHPPYGGDGREDSEAPWRRGDRRLGIAAQLVFGAAIIGAVSYAAYNPVSSWEFFLGLGLLVLSGWLMIRR